MSVLYPRARTPVLGLGQEGIEALLDAESLERGDLLVLGREPRQIRVLDHVVEREAAAHQHLGRGGPAVANVLGAERAVDPPCADPADPPALNRLLGGQP